MTRGDSDAEIAVPCKRDDARRKASEQHGMALTPVDVLIDAVKRRRLTRSTCMN